MLAERSTSNHYRKQAKVICRYLGYYRLSDVTVPVVSGWMAQMLEEGYAPRSVSSLRRPQAGDPGRPAPAQTPKTDPFRKP